VAIEVTMPQMGADMTEGTLVRWVKQVGESVTRGEIIAEIETDKATVELEAYESGTLIKHIVAEGETVPVGEVIGLIGDPSEMAGEVERKSPAVTPAKRENPPGGSAAVNAAEIAAPAQSLPTAPAIASVPLSAGAIDGTRVRISPVARRIATDAGFDVRALLGSGPDGRILRRDVEQAIAMSSAAQAVVPSQATARRPAVAGATTPPVVALTKIRQAIARRMTASKQQQPHYYLTLDIDMTDALSFRTQLNAAATEQQKVSINDLVVKACATALQRHPKFNAEFGDGGLHMHGAINIDIGIALDEGLIAPAILDVAHKSLGVIAEEAKDLVARAKSGHLRADEYAAGTFTITNLGAYGVETLIGIINPPQAAILGVGSVMAQAVVRDGQVVPRQVMKIALSADHRVTDGAEGARFIKEIQALLENPASLAL
jgi:pyruvate dehydrogenase E2 component (dihydrolipoamide acetyltransferase)